jgi:hypothetical protein|tara:strand:- start:147 stop:260 length:114 start_codon:yes stop_codon:yes gene_type:complete
MEKISTWFNGLNKKYKILVIFAVIAVALIALNKIGIL